MSTEKDLLLDSNFSFNVNRLKILKNETIQEQCHIINDYLIKKN